jgi:hypothetical protein
MSLLRRLSNLFKRKKLDRDLWDDGIFDLQAFWSLPEFPRSASWQSGRGV